MKTGRNLIQIVKKPLHPIQRSRLWLLLFCGLFAAVRPVLAQTWTQTGVSNFFESVASSADGTKLVAGSFAGLIFTLCGFSAARCS